jgi:hypothetical protein
MYTAIIIEPRKHPSLPIVLNNFNKNLDEKWNFLIFHGKNNKKYIENIFNNIETTKKCNYINLNKNNLTIKEYNNLLYSHIFYNYIKTEHFLIFQTDSLISDYNYNNIYKFLEYDYVGAPWKHRNNEIGNGGLSLRKKSKMLELLNNNFCLNVLDINEDLFFSGIINNINNINVYKPSVELAKEFSTESIFSNNSFGLHKPWLHLNKYNLDLLKILFPNLNNLMNIWNNYDKILNKSIKKKSLKPTNLSTPNKKSLRPTNLLTPNKKSLRPTNLLTPNKKSLKPSNLLTPNKKSLKPSNLLTPNKKSLRPTNLLIPKISLPKISLNHNIIKINSYKKILKKIITNKFTNDKFTTNKLITNLNNKL